MNYKTIQLQMKKTLFFVLLCTLVLVSCSNENAISWNANLTAAYNKIIDDLDNFEELISLETMGDTLVNQQIEVLGQSLLADIGKTIKHLEDDDVPSEANACQKAAMEMFKCMDEQVRYGLKFTEFVVDTPEAEVDVFADAYDELSQKTAVKADAFSIAHESFKDSIADEEE